MHTFLSWFRFFRINQNKIRTLETRDRQREEFLKRKIEQYGNVVGRQQRTPMGVTPASLRSRYGLISKKTFSPTVAKTKWRKLEQKMNAVVSEHAGMRKLDEQHVRLLNELVLVDKQLKELVSDFPIRVRFVILAFRTKSSSRPSAWRSAPPCRRTWTWPPSTKSS